MAVDLQAATPDTSVPAAAFLFGADSQAASAPSVYAGKDFVSAMLSDMVQTWNAGGTTFTGIKLNVTDTASASGSLLMDLQIGGASVFSVRKDGAAGIQTTAPLAPLHIGSGTVNNSINAMALISRTYSGSQNAHAFSDSSTFSGTLNTAYNSFDARVLVSSAFALDHYAGFQMAPVVNTPAALGWLYGYYGVITNQSGSVVNNFASFFAANSINSGTLSAQYGLYVEELTSGTGNYAIWTQGTTPSRFGGAVTIVGALNSGTIASTGDVRSAASGYFYWTGRSGLDSPADGNIRIANQAVNGFGRLQFGGTTSSFPSLKRSSAAIHVRLADDSNFAELVFKLPTSNPGAGTLWNNGGTLAIGT